MVSISAIFREVHIVEGPVADPESLMTSIAAFSRALDGTDEKSIERALAATDEKNSIRAAIKRIEVCHDTQNGAIPYLAELMGAKATDDQQPTALSALSAMVRDATLAECFSPTNRLLTREHIDAAIKYGYLACGIQALM